MGHYVSRPMRAFYRENDLKPEYYIEDYGMCTREKVRIKNHRGENLVGSYYRPKGEQIVRSCVIYLHCNCSCQVEGTFLVPYLVPNDISLLVFDFAGCGLSDGKIISLGLFEKDDVDASVHFLNTEYGITDIVLWGRSMGAATTLMYLDNQEEVKGAIVDSPFASLPRLVKESAQIYLKCFACCAVHYINRDIPEFDIFDVVPLANMENKTTPAIFIHAKGDRDIPLQHTEDLYNSYSCSRKAVYYVKGAHNSDRPLYLIVNCMKFIFESFGKKFNKYDIEKIHRTYGVDYEEIYSIAKLKHRDTWDRLMEEQRLGAEGSSDDIYGDDICPETVGRSTPPKRKPPRSGVNMATYNSL